MTNDEMRRFTFRMPKELNVLIKNASAKKGVSVNALILQILWEWLKNKTKQEEKWKKGMNQDSGRICRFSRSEQSQKGGQAK